MKLAKITSQKKIVHKSYENKISRDTIFDWDIKISDDNIKNSRKDRVEKIVEFCGYKNFYIRKV